MARYTIKGIIIKSTPVLLTMIIFSLITGQRLESALHFIVVDHPLILILIPSYINITGYMGDVYASRLTSYLYKGELTANYRPFRLTAINILSIISVNSIAYILTAVISNFVTEFLFNTSSQMFPLIQLVLFSGLLATFIVIIGVTLLIRFVYLKGMDPDSIMAPITTTVGDTIATLRLIYFAPIFLL